MSPAFSWLAEEVQENFDKLPDEVKNALLTSRPRIRTASKVKAFGVTSSI